MLICQYLVSQIHVIVKTSRNVYHAGKIKKSVIKIEEVSAENLRQWIALKKDQFLRQGKTK